MLYRNYWSRLARALSIMRASRARAIGHTLESEPVPGRGPSEKVDPIPKFTVWVKDSFLTNSRVLISNITIVFSKILAQKTPNQAVWSQI